MYDSIISIIHSGWLYTGFAVVAVVSTIITILIILSENRNPVKSLAWVTVLLLLPVVGLILYLFFGRNLKNMHMISRRNRRKLRRGEKRVHTDPRRMGLGNASLQQINLGRSLTGAQFYADNHVEVFTDGRSKFDSLLADLRRARHSINLQYYIFEDDNIGRQVADILKEKAAAGVTVRVIYDHVGSFSVRSRFFRELRNAGVAAHPFFKVTFPQFGTRVNWRNHRKMVIIDQTVGYLGGMNVADRYIDGGRTFDSWRDTHVRVIGPVVAALQYSFAVDWAFMGGELIDESVRSDSTVFIPSPSALGGIGAQLLVSGPTHQWANIALAFHKAIANAQRRVFIHTPYFLPTEALLKALQSAALAHVDVRIMLPDKSDSRMLTMASNSYISESLRAGIKIYRYKPGMLHSKMIIVDDEFVSIGSTNFDFRSFECNFESNLFFFSREFNERMTEIFRNDLRHSTRIEASAWRKRPFGQRFVESLVRLLSPVL